MALMNEDFTRCGECGNAWFTSTRVALLAKTSTEEHITILRERIEFKCSKCGQVKFSGEDN